MDIWGTRPEGNIERSGKPWTIKELAFAVHGDSLKVGSAEKNVANWRTDKKPPPANATTIKRIEAAFFGDNPAFDNWKIDLRLAQRRSRGGRSDGLTNLEADSMDAPTSDVGSLGLIENAAQELGLRRDLLESLAARFGHTAIDGPDSVLVQFLKGCASDYKTLKEGADEAKRLDESLDEALQEFNRLVASGQRDKADSLLDVVERGHQVRFIRHVGEQVKMRQMRACVALEDGKLAEAFKHFEKIVEMYRPYSVELEESTRVTFAIVLANSGEKGSEAQDLAIQLLGPVADIYRLSCSYGMDTYLKIGNRKISRIMTTVIFFEHPRIMEFLTRLD